MVRQAIASAESERSHVDRLRPAALFGFLGRQIRPRDGAGNLTVPICPGFCEAPLKPRPISPNFLELFSRCKPLI